MPTLAEKIRFAQTYVANKEGTAWSLTKREWVRDQYFMPADGYKLWRPERGEICDDCKNTIGTIIEHPHADNTTRSAEHRETGCAGLDVYPVVVTLLNLIRQDGKTFNGMAMDLADMALGKNVSIALLAASEDQVKTLFDENYAAAIANNARLRKRFRVVGMRLICDKSNSFIEALPASAKSVTGRTRRRVRIDEARDVPSEVAWALIPAIQAMSGIECPRGHTSVIDPDAAIAALNSQAKQCTACGDDLQPFFGRVVAASSSGVSDDEEDYWFRELIEQCEREPSPYVHVFRSSTPLNPAKSPIVAGALQSVFGGLESMRAYVHADMTNEWTRKGEDFITKAELDRCVDGKLTNAVECSDPCVAFLDTSLSQDLTSLVCLASDHAGTEPWERTYTARLEWWDPSAMRGATIDEVVISAHLLEMLPLFSGLRVLHIDVRGMPWALRLAADLRKKGFRVETWDKSTSHESIAGWGELQKRIRSQTIRIIDDARMRREFRGLKIKNGGDGPAKVVDRDRRKSHKDITESLAICCYLAALEGIKKRSGLASRVAPAEQARATLSRLRAKTPSISKQFGPNRY